MGPSTKHMICLWIWTTFRVSGLVAGRPTTRPVTQPFLELHMLPIFLSWGHPASFLDPFHVSVRRVPGKDFAQITETPKFPKTCSPWPATYMFLAARRPEGAEV